MIIGTDKERKVDKKSRIVEWRVGITPGAVEQLTRLGHKCIIETKAGQAAGFYDEDYHKSGAEIVSTQEEVYARSDMIYKVKEPQKSEWKLFRKQQVLFTYIHSANRYEMLQNLVDKEVTAIAYEDVQTPDGRLPMLEPMSIIAGHIAQQKAYMYLLQDLGNIGIMSGYMAGVAPAKVCVVGTGFAGEAAIRIASASGSLVFALYKDNFERAQRIERTYQGVHCLKSTPDNIKIALEGAHILNNSMTWPINLRNEILISSKDLDLMFDKAIIIDVSAELQGGLETTRGIHTSHAEPTIELAKKTHYVVPNVPAIAPHSASIALVNVTLPWVIKVASGWKWDKADENDPLYIGTTCAGGKVINKVVEEWYYSVK